MGRPAYFSYILLVEARHLFNLSSGDSFWAVAIFITSFRCLCVRQLRTSDVFIFITEKACSHKYVVPNIQSVLPEAVSIGYCGGKDCNSVVILQRRATLQFYQFHLDRLWDLGSVNREWRAKKRQVLFQFSKNHESIVKLMPESGKQVCVLVHTVMIDRLRV